MTDQSRTEANTSSKSKDNTPAKPRKKRRLLKVMVALFVLLLAFVALLPTIVSTGFGTGTVLSFVNKSLPGSVEIDDLSVGWFSSTSVKGLRLKDPDGNVVIAANADAPDVTLLGLIRGDMSFGDVTLVADEVNIEQYEDGSLNLDRALGPSEKKTDEEPGKMPAGLSVNLQVKAPKATLKPYKQEKAVLTDGLITLNVISAQQIKASVTGQIQQGAFKGSIKTAADVQDLFGPDGKLQIAKLKIEAPENSATVPTGLVDGLSNANGKLAALAGPDITVTYSASGSLGDLKAKLNIKSPRLTINANAAVKMDDNLNFVGLKMDEPELLHLAITKETWDQISTDADGKRISPLDFVSAGDLVVTSVVDLKAGPGGINLSKSTATFKVAAMEITVKDPNGDLRTLTLDGVTVTFDGPSGTFVSNGGAFTDQRGERGKFTFNAKADHVLKADGALDYDKLTVVLNAKVENFALSLLDEIFTTKGWLANTLGGKLNATANLDLKPTADGNEGTLSVMVNPTGTPGHDQFNANLGGPISVARKQTDKGVVFDNIRMKLAEPGRITAKLSQPVLAMLEAMSPALKEQLAKATLTDRRVTLMVNQFEGPLDETLMGKARASVAVQVEPFSYDLGKGDKPDANGNVANKVVQLENLNLTADFSGQSQPLVVGFSSLARHGGQTADLNATATVTDLFNAAGEVDTDTLTAKITANLNNLPTALAGAMINQPELVRHGVGESLTVTLDADAKLNKSGDKTNYDGGGTVTVSNPAKTTDIKLTGKLVGDRLQLNTAPDASYAKLMITQSLASAIQKMQGGDTAADPNAVKWNIAKDTPLTLTFTKADLPIGGDTGSAILAFTASMPELALTGDQRFDGAAVRDFKVTMNGDTVGKQVDLAINGRLIHLDQEGKLSIKAVVAKPLEDTRGIDANIQIDNAPSALADAFAGLDGLIGKLEGKAIKSVTATFKRTGDAPDTFGVNLQSTTLQAGFAGAYTPGKRFDMTPNQRITFTLTNPEAWPIIKRKFADQLPAMLKDAEVVTGTITLDLPTLNLALAEVKVPAKQALGVTGGVTQTTTATAQNAAPAPADAPAGTAEETATKIVAANSRMVMNLTSDELYIQRAGTNRAVKLQDVAVKLDSGLSLNQAAVSVAARPVSVPLVNGKPAANGPQANQANAGELNVNAVAKSLADKDGYFAPSISTVTATVKATNVSAAALDDALNQGGLIVGLFKDTANLTGNFDMAPGKPGAFDINLTSGNLRASGKGVIENDVVTLSDDFNSSFMLTKDMPDAVRNFLVIIKVVSDEKPLSLIVPAKGFRMPLNFGDGDLIDITKVEADIAFDLGTVKAEGDGIAATVVGVITQATGAQKQIGRLTSAAFTPGNVVLKNGIVTYKEPMKMDYGGVSFSYSGAINLNTKSLDQLSITVPFSSIKAKEIQSLAGGIPVPIGGNLDAPKLDAGKLTKEMVNVALKAGLNRGLGELIPGGNKPGLPGLDGLFPPKNKPEENKPEPGKSDDGKSGSDNDTKKPTVEDAAVDILRGVLGGNKPKPKDEPKKEDEKKDEQKSKSGDDGKGLLEGLIGGGKKEEKKEDAKKE